MSVKYLVSGGEGALGKTVISMLLQRGEKVRILMSELSDTRIYRNNPNIEICYGISTDKDSMREFFELDDPRSAVLFHTDEYVSLSDSTNLTMRRVNVIGAENVVDMCLKRKIGKLVYLSSAYALNPEVSGEDLTIHFDRNKVEGEYAKSKAEAAAYVMEKIALNRLNAVMVLPTFIIGPGYSEDYEINKVLNSYLNNGTIPPREGGRAFVDVRDVANAMLTLADKGEAGAGYIISGDYKTSGEFFKDVNEISGNDAPVKTASRLVMSKSLAKLVDFYYKITHKENPKQAYTLFSDNPDARFEDNTSGILPEITISFKESLKDTIEGAQHGGIQAAAAVKETKPERKSSADAMEARLKQQQNVTAKAHTTSTSQTEAPAKPAHTRPATAAAQAAAAAKAAEEEAAKKEEEKNKSIIPESSLKDPANNYVSDEEKLDSQNKETTFRFGTATATTFTRIQQPAQEPAKSIIPPKEPPKTQAPAPAAPKSEPVKSIIPQMPPKSTEAPKPAEAPKAAEPKAAEAPKPAAPSSGFPRAAATPSSGFPRAAATPSSGFPKAAATPAAPSAPKAEAPKPAEAPKAAEPKAAEAPKPAAPSSGFPRAAATPSSGFPKAAATPSAPAPAAPAAPAAPKEAPSQPINSAFKSAQTESQSPFKSAPADNASPFKNAQADNASPFKNAQADNASPFKASKSDSSNMFKNSQAEGLGQLNTSGLEDSESYLNPHSNGASAYTPIKSDSPSPFKTESSSNIFATDKSGGFMNSADDIEAEIEAFSPSSGSSVPPGIFAPPKNPGN
ncbi:MAG: NAD-dependent epimerase/dehydratase family protein [Saccharofermentans sp.]|nr:NAD-dependent epimerase/dehydratase family protein [Saccharofermentans sp.]